MTIDEFGHIYEDKSIRKDRDLAPSDGSDLAGNGIGWNRLWELILRLGLGEVTLRAATGITSVVLVLIVVWVMSSFYMTASVSKGGDAVSAAPLPTQTGVVPSPYFDVPDHNSFSQGLVRLTDMHTIVPAKPRNEVTTYEVQTGDTIFGIAEKFNLKPETLLWSNYYILGDNPHNLSPGQELNILPVNGIYYEWHAGDGLNGVAKFFGVTPEDIIGFSANNLSMDTIGDLTNPNIEPGSWIIVPGGSREFVNWSAPRITRSDPSVAKILGPGFCGEIMDGPVGTGVFLWPSVERRISGFDYSPETNHRGIDIGGYEGVGIFATDAGVTVYAGWNDWGYGNVVVIDHGNGWQSLYAHLSTLNVECGSYVFQGTAIGGMGSTGRSSGPHLHFELLSDTYGKVDPKNFLQ